ncbi:MAG: hypothetical protein HY712_05490 [candidate division NC10 bacterium]|nr:hypothetical protein [candidate division NC10 bacterium]
MNNAKVPLAILVSWMIFEALPTTETLARTLTAVALLVIALCLTESRSPSKVG